MKNYPRFLIAFALVTTLFSCRSSKDLIYFKDTQNNEITHGSPREYVIKQGDILYVSIKSIDPEVNSLYNPENDMSRATGAGYQDFMKYTTPSGAYLYGYEVDQDGNINLPMLGKIKVLGVVLPQLESVVQKRANEFLNDAVVKVKLLNFKITVAGEVKNPGTYYNYNNSITILEALAMANGNTDFASIKKVMVIRTIPDGKKSYIVDLSSKKVYLSDAFYLEPDDCVIVQPDRNKNLQLNSQAYSLVLSSLSVMLAVLGFALK